MGHVLKNGISLIGSSAKQSIFDEPIKDMIQISNKYSNILTEREKNHVEAIKYLHFGDLDKACNLWENILIENPTDMVAIKFAHDIYFYLGHHMEMRDSISRVLPKWKSHLPYYSYLYGLQSFGFIQTNFSKLAKQAALKSLEMNKNDGWATHTLCHYYEYENEYNDGIQFLRNTEKDWSICDFIATHNYWHLSLYHIDKGEHEAALDLFDQNISTSLSLDRTLDMVDLISFLFRLKLDGCQVDLKEKWLALKDVYISRLNDHGYIFNDAHIVIMLSSLNDSENLEKFYKSLDDYLNYDTRKDLNENCLNNDLNNLSYLKKVNKKLAKKIFDSICLFNNGEYSKVVENLYPVRYDLIQIGGSNAQRDLFHQMITQAALRSDNIYHNKLGLALLNERIAIKPHSMLNQRIAARFAANHF
jgi:hypothetical protein